MYKKWNQSVDNPLKQPSVCGITKKELKKRSEEENLRKAEEITNPWWRYAYTQSEHNTAIFLAAKASRALEQGKTWAQRQRWPKYVKEGEMCAAVTHNPGGCPSSARLPLFACGMLAVQAQRHQGIQAMPRSKDPTRHSNCCFWCLLFSFHYIPGVRISTSIKNRSGDCLMAVHCPAPSVRNPAAL